LPTLNLGLSLFRLLLLDLLHHRQNALSNQVGAGLALRKHGVGTLGGLQGCLIAVLSDDRSGSITDLPDTRLQRQLLSGKQT
jgi:hypothetical protein